MVKRKQHIGMFLHSEMGVSWGGMSLMCGCSSIHLQKIFFLKSIAPLPTWVLDRVEETQHVRAQERAAWVRGEGASIPERQRNDTLFKQACAMRREGKAEEAMLPELLAINEQWCDPPLSKREIEQI